MHFFVQIFLFSSKFLVGEFKPNLFCLPEGSAFMFGRALTSVLWGMIADRYGRKPVILFGTVAVLVLLDIGSNMYNFPDIC